MTSSYVAVLACYGRPPLSRVGVSEVCMEPSINSNTIWYAQNLPLMRRIAEPGRSRLEPLTRHCQGRHRPRSWLAVMLELVAGKNCLRYRGRLCGSHGGRLHVHITYLIS